MSIFGSNVFFILNRGSQIVFLLTVVSVLVFFNSCKQEDNFPNELRLNMVVVNDLDSVVTGAKIYIFDDQQIYESARGTGNFTTAKDSGISMPGGNTFYIEGNKEHWVFIQYFDNVRDFILSNTGDGKIDKLVKQSEVDTKFFIAPITGNVVFWAEVQTKLPVNIFFNGIPYSLNTFASMEPTSPNDANVLVIPNVLAGSYQYTAVAANNCIFTGTVNVQRGGFHPIKVAPCTMGRITFIAPSFNPIHGAITVKLDVNDVLTPTIFENSGVYVCGSGSGVPTTSSGNFISVTREVNTNPYSYVARTQDGACTWTGSVLISSDTCVVINLPTCP